MRIIGDSIFWQNFWPNFWADLLVGIVIAGLISWVFSKARKVEAKMSVRTEHVNESSIRLRFSVWNTGKISFRSEEVFWHALIDTKLKPQNPDVGTTDQLTVQDRSFMHIKGMLGGPVFPSRHTECFSVAV